MVIGAIVIVSVTRGDKAYQIYDTREHTSIGMTTGLRRQSDLHQIASEFTSAAIGADQHEA
ncbi:hypothetical protein CCP1ISM_190005 [Azospirillaceae bacterium]